MKKAGRILIPVLLVTAALAATLGAKLKPQDVTATQVVRGRAVDAVYATGTVEAQERVLVKAKTSGALAEVFVREGQSVTRGALLARIDNPVVTYELKRGEVDRTAAAAQAVRGAPQIEVLRGQWQATAAEAEIARTELRRFDTLVATGAASHADADRARARLAQLAGVLAANEAQQKALRIDLSANAARQVANVQALATRVADTEVRAPMDGVVLQKLVDLSEVVSVNQPLFRIGDTSRLILEVLVDEADIARVREPSASAPGSTAAVNLYAFPRQVWKGEVVETLPDADRARKVFVTKVRLIAPPPGLRSGMSAEVNIITATHEQALLAPTDALEEGRVWVVSDDRAQLRSVRIGLRDLLRAEVRGGLREGEWVVVGNKDGLEPGARVRVTERRADKREPLPDLTSPAQNTVP